MNAEASRSLAEGITGGDFFNPTGVPGGSHEQQVAEGD